MTEKLMTAAVMAALALTLGALAGGTGPLAHGDGEAIATTASAQSSTPVARAKTGDRELSGYHDPHDRKRNIAASRISSCWVQTRYGTVNICGADGGDD